MEEAGGPARQEVHGNQNAISFSGDASVHIHPPAVSCVLPDRVWMVPYRRNPFFTGREQLLSALQERFTTNRIGVLTQGQAISGLGGIGKTQVAVEYAYRHQEHYRFVFWVNATTPTTLTTDLVTIADRLQLPERLLQEQEKIVVAVLHWLATNTGWLLLVDNADELEQVWPTLPTGSTGHVLLTTRDQATGELERFPVEQLDRQEGLLLLLRRAALLTTGMEVEDTPRADRQVAEQIVIAMDGLPLALDQAGAYIEETECSLSDYWTRYQQQRRVLLRHRGRSGRAYPNSVASTWSLSFQQVERRSAAAAALLSLCAYLSAEAIPEAIITKGASQLGEPLQALGQDQGQLDSAIGVLRAYSLLRRNPEEHTLSVHRLVQAVLRDGMDGTARRSWAEQAMQAVNGAFPFVEHHTWSQCDRLLPMPCTVRPGLSRSTSPFLRQRACSIRQASISGNALGIQRPSPCMCVRWRSASSSWDRSTPTPQAASTTWLPSTTHRASTSRPSRCISVRWRFTSSSSELPTLIPRSSGEIISRCCIGWDTLKKHPDARGNSPLPRDEAICGFRFPPENVQRAVRICGQEY